MEAFGIFERVLLPKNFPILLLWNQSRASNDAGLAIQGRNVSNGDETFFVQAA